MDSKELWNVFYTSLKIWKRPVFVGKTKIFLVYVYKVVRNIRTSSLKPTPVGSEQPED